VRRSQKISPQQAPGLVPGGDPKITHHGLLPQKSSPSGQPDQIHRLASPLLRPIRASRLEILSKASQWSSPLAYRDVLFERSHDHSPLPLASEWHQVSGRSLPCLLTREAPYPLTFAGKRPYPLTLHPKDLHLQGGLGPYPLTHGPNSVHRPSQIDSRNVV
jgi:hypothetical protein